MWSTGDLSNAVHTVKIVRSATSLAGKYLTIDAVDVVGTLLGAGRIEQADAHLAYAGTWSAVSATGASGGSYKRASGSGAAVYVDFTGIELAWIATTGPGMGKAWVSVDGRRRSERRPGRRHDGVQTEGVGQRPAHAG